MKKSKINKLKSSGLGLDPPTPIFCSEHLTPYTKILVWAKELWNEGAIKYVWTKEGTVYVRKEDSTPAIKVPDEIALKRVADLFARSDQDTEDSDETSGIENDAPMTEAANKSLHVHQPRRELLTKEAPTTTQITFKKNSNQIMIGF